MDGLTYYAALAVIAIFIFQMTRTHNNFLAFIALLVGVYIVYSHETGYTATDFRHDMVNTIDENAVDFSKSDERDGSSAPIK